MLIKIRMRFGIMAWLVINDLCREAIITNFFNNYTLLLFYLVISSSLINKMEMDGGGRQRERVFTF